MRVSKGTEFNADRYKVVSKTQIWTRWKKFRNISGTRRKEAFEQYLLHEEGISELYQKRLTEYVQF